MSRVLFVLRLLLSITPAFADSGSLYSASIQWKSDQGKSLRLETYRGKWVVISMMYTSCLSSCPMVVKKMRQIEALIKKSGKDAQFVLVTFDPERDTPEKLGKYREKIAVQEPNWHFLSGAAADTRKLSMLLGIKYTRDAESGEILHDNKIVLLSPEGKIAAKLQSLGDPDEEIVQAIKNRD